MSGSVWVVSGDCLTGGVSWGLNDLVGSLEGVWEVCGWSGGVSLVCTGV